MRGPPEDKWARDTSLLCGVSQTAHTLGITVHPVLENHILIGIMCRFFLGMFGFLLLCSDWRIDLGLLFPGASNVLVTEVSAVS